jgi:hypothetical protein
LIQWSGLAIATYGQTELTIDEEPAVPIDEVCETFLEDTLDL